MSASPPVIADTAAARAAARPLATGLWRGFRRRCPQCGRHALFQGYLRPVAACPGCGLETARFRADDAPPYFTILLVGHVIGPGMLLTETRYHPAAWVHMAVWIPLAVILTLALLPRIKGAVIGAQWALKIKN